MAAEQLAVRDEKELWLYRILAVVRAAVLTILLITSTDAEEADNTYIERLDLTVVITKKGVQIIKVGQYSPLLRYAIFKQDIITKINYRSASLAILNSLHYADKPVLSYIRNGTSDMRQIGLEKRYYGQPDYL